MRVGLNPLIEAMQSSPWETVRLARDLRGTGVGRGFQRDLTYMNANDAKAIGDEPWEFCMQDVKDALRVMLEHAPGPDVTGKTLHKYNRRMKLLRLEVERRVE